MCLLPVQIYFHRETTEQGSEHIVRVRKDGTVEDVLAQLAQQLGPAAKQHKLRLLEVHSSKLYKVGGAAQCITCMLSSERLGATLTYARAPSVSPLLAPAAQHLAELL